MKLKGLLLLAILAFAEDVEAQKPWRIKQIYRANPPKAIFVQLFTYPRRIEYYKKNNKHSELKQFGEVANDVATQMVKDFNVNFDFCPVYYYYDSNAHYIRDRKFAGKLLDKDLQPAQNIIVQPADTNFFIVVNGLLISEDLLPGRAYQENESVFSASDNVNSRKPRIVVLDHNFRQLPRNTVRTPKGSNIHRKSVESFTYSNSRYNLQYRGDAAVLNSNFHSFFNEEHDR